MKYSKFKKGQVFISTPKNPKGKFLYKVHEQSDGLVVLDVFTYVPFEVELNSERVLGLYGCSQRTIDATIIEQLLQDNEIEEREDGEFLYDFIMGKFKEIEDAFENDVWHELK